MEVRAVDEATQRYEPVTESEGKLVTGLFETATDLFPDWKMSDRTDLAMSMFVAVKKWAHEDDAANVIKGTSL